MKRPNLSSQADTKSSGEPAHREFPAVLFDLDGTLIDSNYQHVNAWSEALMAADIVIPRWKINAAGTAAGNTPRETQTQSRPTRKTTQ